MKSTKLFLILGDQLFPHKYTNKYKKDHIFFMAEDYELCSYFKFHKHKLLFFLSSMRSYADEIKKNQRELIYYKFNEKYFETDYIYQNKKNHYR